MGVDWGGVSLFGGDFANFEALGEEYQGGGVKGGKGGGVEGLKGGGVEGWRG